MKKVVPAILVGVLIGAGAMRFLSRSPDEHPTPGGAAASAPEPASEKKETPFLSHGPDGEPILRLDAAAQARMGLKTSSLSATSRAPVMKAFGRVLDPSPLAVLLLERATARISLDTSTREHARLAALNTTQNASVRAQETAEAAMKKDQLNDESTRQRIILGWGRTVASRIETNELGGALVSIHSALVRVDVPLGQEVESLPAGGRLATLTAPEQAVDAEFLGPAPLADPAMQSQGYLFLIPAHPPTPGTAMLAWLELAGERETGVHVPATALVRHDDEIFVYLRSGEDRFVRRELESVVPVGADVFVRKGLKGGDQIVVTGAQQLWSEEKIRQGGEE